MLGYRIFQAFIFGFAVLLPLSAWVLRQSSARGSEQRSGGAVFGLLQLQTLLPIPLCIEGNLQQDTLRRVLQHPGLRWLLSFSLWGALGLLLPVTLLAIVSQNTRVRWYGTAISLVCVLYEVLLFLLSGATA